MARDPGSVWSPLPEAPSQGIGNTKTQFIVHSTGTLASARANFNYFSRGDVVVESTFIVGLSKVDPTLQILDSTAVADASGSASKRAISVEVVGDGVGGYNDWQRSEIARLGRWAAANHPIEKRIIPSEAASGFGWHVMFGAPGPWTSVAGKVCPGAKRVAELKSTVFPAIFSNPTVQEDDMPYTPAELRELVKDAVWEAPFDDPATNGKSQAWLMFRGLSGQGARIDDVERKVDALGGKLDQILAKLSD